MRLAKRIGLAALVVGLVAASAGRASAESFTYNVSLTVPNNIGDGNLTAIGTITVDKLGTLTTGDITDYSIAISSPNNPTEILNPGTSTFYKDPQVTLSASATDLEIGTGQANTDSFSLERTGAVVNSLGSAFEYTFFPGTTYLSITNQPNSEDTSDGGQSRWVGAGPFVVGTAAVPEPSSAVLATIGAGTVLACGRVRRRRQRRRQAAAV